jgi:putative ABC transport system permease protein
VWDPANARQGYDLRVVSGAVADLVDGGIGVQQDTARDEGLAVGDTVEVEYPGGVRDERVDVIYEDNGFFGPYVAARTTLTGVTSDLVDYVVIVSTADGVEVDRAMAAIRQVVDTSFPGPQVVDRDAFIQSYVDQTKDLITLITALLAMAVVIALLGVANTLALSIFERTRELGLLRAVGMTRSQLRAMVRHEAAIIATFGAGLGLLVGTFFGTALVKALEGQGIEEVVVPPMQLVVLVAVTAVLGLAAAVLPARKAAKVDILEALATA